MSGTYCEKVTDRATLRRLHSGTRRRRPLRSDFFQSGEKNNATILGKLKLSFGKVNLGTKNPVPMSVSQIPPFQ
jgi:hypothetical protein